MAKRKGRAAAGSEEPWRGYVEHGSEEHAAMLGLRSDEFQQDLSPEAVKNDPSLAPIAREKARLERQLKTKPAPSVSLERKPPVNRENYAPTTRQHGPGDEIIDGWTRRGEG